MFMGKGLVCGLRLQAVTEALIGIQFTKAQIAEQISQHKEIPVFGQTIMEQQPIIMEQYDNFLFDGKNDKS